MEKTASEIATVKRNVRLQEWNRQIEEQKSSGQSIQEWCKQKGINPNTGEHTKKNVRYALYRTAEYQPHDRSGLSFLSLQ